MLRKKWRNKVDEAVAEIGRFQRGDKYPFKTELGHLNESSLGGVMAGDIIVLAGLPGHGKTYTLQRIEKSLPILNPGSKIAFLRHYYEMSVFKLMLRRLQMDSGLTMTQILLEQPDENRKNIFGMSLKSEREQEAEVIDQALTPSEFERETEAFLIENNDKDLCVISLDHILLAKGEAGQKKSIVDDIMEACMRLRMKYKNALFLILTQLNREIEDRTNPVEAAPRMSDIFQSSVIAFCADMIMVTHNPYKLGLASYLALPKDKYYYLREFFKDPEPKKFANLQTRGCIYFHYLKVRMPDSTDYKDIFGERIFQEAAPPLYIKETPTLDF